MDGAGLSVSKKMDVFKRNINCLDVESALVLLAITWRNRLVHNFAENKLTDNTREVLSNSKDYIKEHYRGLDVDQLLKSFDSSYKSIPRFKEITALISASITFVTDVDKKLMDRLEVNTYLEEVIAHYILNGTEMEDIDAKHNPVKTVRSIWTKPIEIKKKKLLNVFGQYGCEISIDYTLIESLSSLSYKEALQKFNIRV
ncbi:hypothetical protein [Oceanobacillus oncorhynchi]|uniref:hypothetical protein n=1 Tax=Oceanobacillus oncorhynchi TaxID=545501 RepID=UPI002116802B|nr:hypothetical protein [Oceanobacillus oncorhynchi]UUI39978.1 hypothetical protein NP440_22095 [Oceanobacillus oncorhynchi]